MPHNILNEKTTKKEDNLEKKKTSKKKKTYKKSYITFPARFKVFVNNEIQKTMPLTYRHRWVWYHARTIG